MFKAFSHRGRSRICPAPQSAPRPAHHGAACAPVRCVAPQRALAASAILLATLLPQTALAEQTSGEVGGFPPEDITLTVTTGEGGAPVLSATDYTLALGGYYRFNFTCPDAKDDETGFHFESEGLMTNAHVRVVSVGDMEIYMQGLGFRALECDEPGTVKFSFHPMRNGSYPFLVRDHSEPPQAVTGTFLVE